MFAASMHRIGARFGETERVAFPLLIALLVLSSSTASLAFDPQTQSSLTTVVRIPDRVAAHVQLRIERFELVVADRAIPVAPARPLLDSHGLSGRAVECARVVFEPGPLDSLRVVFGSARVRVGEVWTDVDLEGTSVAFPLRRQVAAGECVVVNLEFQPDATPIDAEPWRPRLVRRHPERPPLGHRLFVALRDAGTVAVLDRRSGDVVAEIGVGGQPVDVAWSAVERRLYVAVAGRDELVAVDLGDTDQLRRLNLRFGDHPVRLLLSDDERELYVLARGHDALIIVSTQAFQEAVRINLEPRPVALALDPRSDRVFVTSELSRTIEVVDPVRGVVSRVFRVRDDPGELIYLAGIEELLVASGDGRSLERFDAVSGASVDTIELCGPVRGLAYQRRSERVYAAMDVCRQVAVLRPGLDLEIGAFPIGGDPGLIRMDPEERMLLVPLVDRDEVLAVNMSRTRDVRVYDVGPGPVAVVVP